MRVIGTALAALVILGVCVGVGRQIACGTKKMAPADGQAYGTDVDVHREIERLRRESQENPDSPSVHGQLATLLSILGRYREAAAELRIAIGLAPDDPQHHYDLAVVYLELAKSEAACNEAVRAAELGKQTRKGKATTPSYSLLAASLLCKAERYAQAEAFYEMTLAQLSAFRSERKIMRLDAGGQEAVIRAEAEGGLKSTRLLVAKDRPSGDWVRRQLTFTRFTVPDAEQWGAKCKDVEERVLSGDYSGESAHLELGDCYLKSGNTLRAVIQFLAATQVSPDSAVGWYNLGVAYMLDGRLDAAAKAFDESTRLGDRGAGVLADTARRLLAKSRSGVGRR